MYLGFELGSEIFFEGSGGLFGARPVSPIPIVTQASFVLDGADPLSKVPDGNSVDTYDRLFREDAFDPVTRIRRGRFYERDLGASNPTACKVLPPLGLQVVSRNQIDSFGLIEKRLTQFRSLRLTDCIKDFWISRPLVVLGWKSAPTFWRILTVETISTGEQVVTLQARSSYGTLPKLLLPNELPSGDRSAISEKYSALASDIFRSAPQSIVDHARDVVECTLRAKMRQFFPSYTGGELDELLTALKPHLNNFRFVEHYGQIVRRFHQRRKTATQDEYEVRPIRENDATLSVLAAGAILCDFGWGEWE